MSDTGIEYVFRPISIPDPNDSNIIQIHYYLLLRCLNGTVYINVKVFHIISSIDENDIDWDTYAEDAMLDLPQELPVSITDYRFMKIEEFNNILSIFKESLIDSENVLKHFKTLEPPDDVETSAILEESFTKLQKHFEEKFIKPVELVKLFSDVIRMKRHDWVQNLIDDLLNNDFADTYKIFERYNDKLRERNLILPCLKTNRFLHTTVKLDTVPFDQYTLKLKSTYSATIGTQDPIQLLGRKQMMKTYKHVKLPKPEELLKEKIKVLEKARDNPNKIEDLWINRHGPLQIPKLESFENVPLFREIYDKIRCESLFLTELASREVYDVSNTFAKLNIEFGNIG